MILSNDTFLVATALGTCYWCSAANSYIQLILPPGSKVIAGEDDHPIDEELKTDYICLSWITSINDAALAQVNKFAPLFKMAKSKTLQETVVMNHCSSCGTHQGDFYLTKPDMPFWPMTEEDAQAIRVVRVDCRIEVEALSVSSRLLFEIDEHGACSLRKAPEPATRVSRARRKK